MVSWSPELFAARMEMFPAVELRLNILALCNGLLEELFVFDKLLVDQDYRKPIVVALQQQLTIITETKQLTSEASYQLQHLYAALYQRETTKNLQIRPVPIILTEKFQQLLNFMNTKTRLVNIGDFTRAEPHA